MSFTTLRKIPPGDVALHNDSALDVLPHDEVRSSVFLNRRDRGQRNLAPIGVSDLRGADCVDSRRFIRWRSERPTESDLSLEDLTHGFADTRRLQRSATSPDASPYGQPRPDPP